MSIRNSVSALIRVAMVVVACTVLAVVALVTFVRPHAQPISDTAAAGAVAPSISPAPVATAAVNLAPAVPAAAPAGECLRHSTVYDGVPATPDNLAKVSTSVLTATVKEVGPPRWKTADGKPPAARQDLTGEALVRLVRLSVDQNLAGEKSSDSIIIEVPGGVIGCHTFDVSGYPLEIQPGQQYVLFLDGGQSSTKLLNASRVMEMWPVAGNFAVTNEGTKMSVADISTAATQAMTSN